MRTGASILVWFLGVGFAEVCHAGKCSYSLFPASASYDSAGGSGNVTVTTASGCTWGATTTNSWLHTTNSGTGSGTLNYTVDANTTFSSRSGMITAGGQNFTVSQAAAPLSLGAALDNTNLVWQTGVDYPWSGVLPPAPSFDAVCSAASGNRNKPNSESWLETTVVGPGTLSFWWKVDSENGYGSIDYLDFEIGGVAVDQIMGQVDWNYRMYQVPAGTNVLTWRYVKDWEYNSGSDQAWLDRVAYTTNQPIALADALNTSGVTWTSGGNTNPTYWTGQTSVTHDGAAAASSGAIYTAQESWMQATISGVTNVGFWWKVSSQANYDYLEFYTNNVLVKRVSGEVDWQSNYFTLAATANTLRWRFAKTNFNIVSQGQNCGWVDQVVFNPAPRSQLVPPTLIRGLTVGNGMFQLSFSGPESQGYTILAAEDLSLPMTFWTVLTNGTFGLEPVTLIDGAATNHPGRFYRIRSP